MKRQQIPQLSSGLQDGLQARLGCLSRLKPLLQARWERRSGLQGPPPDYCELIRASRPCKPVKQTGHKDRLSHRKSALSPDEIMSSIVE